jgi:glycosyltransferase involved in cell wall biosynthesis
MFPSENPKNEVIKIITSSIIMNSDIKIMPYGFARSFFSRYDIFHVHWPDAVLFPAPMLRVLTKYFLFLSFVLFTKITGRRIVWTVHNLDAHDKRYSKLEKILWWIFLSNVDCAMHLCPQSKSLLAEKYGAKVPFAEFVVPHPHYREEYGRLASRKACRDVLGIEQNVCVFIFFGMIRRYKGVERLLDAFSRIEEENVRLIIAGEIKGGFSFSGDFEDLISRDQRITYIPGFLPTKELLDLVRASDCVVLPYQNVLNSGVANAALSLERPILGPQSGCLIDYHDRLGERWVKFLGNDLTASLEQFASLADRYREDGDTPDLGFADPATVGMAIANIYERTLNEKNI